MKRAKKGFDMHKGSLYKLVDGREADWIDLLLAVLGRIEFEEETESQLVVYK